ncbi:hypothetical protein RhiirC2_714465 [Rhizophagus irregularis]|uniref:Uncharacterized protein n=1 Tax=Rhizophagus irregularis TaxID=588596 RepID=A0A2N1MZF8_9GLOM|nr:hypothetical protein RhiirC2_714465 [Rhizophagus irregularis]
MSGRKIKIYLQEDLHKQLLIRKSKFKFGSFGFGSKVLKLSFILRPASISGGYQLRFGWTSLNYWVPAPSWTRLLGWIKSGFNLDILSSFNFGFRFLISKSIFFLIYVKCYANISSELEFLFLFCRALTLNLDLYFFSFFSYPGGEQHCFD